ncbi:acyl carrier protein [Stappia indica]|uniref:Phthiocerol/phenolphthiocerol synthesis type-I polyketide synthase B n=2 Tax=Stappia indica TaxID=538381 RepID=A0A285RXC6_9HYPH|nr:acyl carrier protein [Stappia indica]MCC4244509.1 acyl carrier protein [Stappia indica]SOB99156.1 phthiocerol/phenolphthiocerol synthesis type-I polyketide synthase B [Stappia indica]
MSDIDESQFFSFLRDRVAQRTKTEADAIGMDMSLADLGLQSIDAVLVCGEVEDRFGVEVDPADIFEHDTLGEFARAILKRAGA